MPNISNWKQQVLFTPGPLTTSMAVKQAMLRDVGHRDFEFVQAIKDVRKKILEIGEVDGKGYEAVLLQGSGTYAVEAVISTGTPEDGKWLVIENGAYGARISKIIDINKIARTSLVYAENELAKLDDIEKTLADDPAITHVAVVHNETTTGMVNPIDDIGKIVKKHNKIYFVDAMSSFGAFKMPLDELNIDWIACTANKNIEGVPGFAFAVVKKDVLLACEGNARALVLDLVDQWKAFEKNGQFRFSPPTHSILAFKKACEELDAEGGVAGREARYRENYETLINGMAKIGFTEYLPREIQGHIIVSWNYPDDPNFDFNKFYKILNDRGYVIYPGKVSNADCFRLAVCGRLFKNDMLDVMNAIQETLDVMGVKLK
jgi:2-aminoethylphosphonate-pyruvate transaminase